MMFTFFKKALPYIPSVVVVAGGMTYSQKKSAELSDWYSNLTIDEQRKIYEDCAEQRYTVSAYDWTAAMNGHMFQHNQQLNKKSPLREPFKPMKI